MPRFMYGWEGERRSMHPRGGESGVACIQMTTEKLKVKANVKVKRIRESESETTWFI